MQYVNIVTGIFIKRLNRFVALVRIDGSEAKVHVKNTGRLKELLVPDAICFLQEHDDSSRKTKYSLIATKKGDTIVNIDSQAPNKVFHEAIVQGLRLPGLKGSVRHIRSEMTFGDSRLDFFVETDDEEAFIEIKGATLEVGGQARFPDAPTIRGVKHIKELISAREAGYKAFVIFIIQMKGTDCFSPNDDMHAEFGDVLRQANKSGVHVLAYDCHVTPEALVLDRQVRVIL